MRTGCVRSQGHCRCFGMLLQKIRRPGVGCVVGDAKSTVPVTKVLTGGGLGGRSGSIRKFANGSLSPLNCSTGRVFQQNPDRSRVEPFPKIRARNTEARSGHLPGPSNSGRSPSVAAPYWQRTFASKTKGLRMRTNHGGFHPIRSRRRLLGFRHCARLGMHRPLRPAKRPGGCFGGAAPPQSRRSPRVLVNSPLTEEARMVLYQLPKLWKLWTALQEHISLPPMSLPSLVSIVLDYDSPWG